MKRYVKEFYNDLIKSLHNEEEQKKIDEVNKHYYRGYLTSYEAIKGMIEIVERYK